MPAKVHQLSSTATDATKKKLEMNFFQKKVVALKTVCSQWASKG